MNVLAPDQLASLLECGRRARKEGDRSAALASFEAAAAIAPANRDVQVEMARELRALDRLEEATLTLRRLLDAGPDDLSALVELAHVRRQLGDRKGSLAAFEKACAVDPNHRGVMLEASRDLRALNRLDDAARVIALVLEAAPRDVGALMERGHLCRGRGDHNAALAAFREAAASDPNHPLVSIEIARELRSLNRLDDAAGVLAMVMSVKPDNPRALLEHGYLLRQRDDHRGALAAFQRAAAADPSLSGAKLELARELRLLQRLDEAEEALTALIDAAPGNPWPLVELGFVRRLRSDHIAAAAAFEKASTADPRHVGIKHELAAEYRALGWLRQAETILCDLLKDQPDNSAAAISLGRILIDANRLDEAEALLTTARRAKPHDPLIPAGLGYLARRRGDRAAALRQFQTAADIDPRNLDIRLELAAEMREQGLVDNALRLVQSVLEPNPEHSAAWVQLGLLYRAKNERPRAMEAFETAIAKRPSETQSLVELAREKWVLGHPDEADNVLQRALSQEPSHLGALIVSAEYALMREDPEEALRLAARAIELHPKQLRPYLLGARAATDARDRQRAELLLKEAEERFGSLPEVSAARVNILRHYREHGAARSLIEQTGDHGLANFGFWMESTSLAITLGDLGKADSALATAPARSRRELARVHHLRARLGEARRDYQQAIDGYEAALVLDPSNGGWHDDLARVNLLLMHLAAAREHLEKSFELDRGTRTARGQSRNISQSHSGQLLDEFTIDGRILNKLEKFCRLPAKEQLEPLKQLVRDNADHTAPAILLVLAMRRAGLLTSSRRQQDNCARTIPRQIAQFWHGESPPADITVLLASWREMHPDYDYRLFNDRSAERFLTERCRPEVARAFRRAIEPAQRADIFRLGYLLSDGGYYVDADDRCLAPLHAVLPASADFVGYQEVYATIANNFIGGVSGHPVIARALHLAAESVNRGDRDIIWLSTGPGLLTRAFAHVAAQPDGRSQLGGAAVLELWEACRAIGIHCPVGYKRTSRHWSGSAFLGRHKTGEQLASRAAQVGDFARSISANRASR